MLHDHHETAPSDAAERPVPLTSRGDEVGSRCPWGRRVRPAGVAVVLAVAMALAPYAGALAEPFRIRRDSIVQGSTGHGGLQPDYLVRLKDRGLRPVMRAAARVGRSNLPYWQKVRKVRDVVSRALPQGEYDEPHYHAIMAKYRKSGKPVPLGKYAQNGVGVCREHYLILHLALASAGIDSQAVYVKAGQRVGKAWANEDHGLVVLRGGPGNGWTVDSYNSNFDGVRFADLLKPNGVGKRDPVAPYVSSPPTAGRRIVSVNPYPVVRPAPTNGLRKIADGLLGGP